jgi:hypothetical protein
VPTWANVVRSNSGGERSNGKVKVLYVTGTGRSGSTVIANALGQVHGFFSVGELRQVWRRGLIENWLCGCGARFQDCELWKDIFEEAFGGAGNVDPAALVAAERRVSRVRHVPRVLLSRRRPGLIASRLESYPAHLDALYQAVRKVTGCDVIVDSSKTPTYGRLLELAPSVELFVLHLVRDPRGAAYSWRKLRAREDAGGDRDMDVFGPLKSSALWNFWNATGEALWRGGRGRYVRMRYEDVVARPRESMARILALFDRGPGDLAFLNGQTIDLAVSHTVSGNPNRLQRGSVELRADLEWMQWMPKRDRLIVTAATIQGLGRYGYPLWPSRPGKAAGSTAMRTGGAGGSGYVEDLSGLRRGVVRARRNWYWGRTHGWAALAEEHDVNPFVRVPRAVRKRRWRRAHGGPRGGATPVYLVGAQRSGTNMVVHGLDESPEFEVRNEGDRRAFENFKLRPDPVIRDLVEASRHRYVLLKPLCDSHRVDHLLDDVGTTKPGLAIWAYRDVDGRVRSALAKFGDVNLRVLRDLAAGKAGERWQVQRLSPDSVDLVRSLDLDRMSAASGAALFWYLRNRLYFELGLHERPDATLVSYDAFLARPHEAMRSLCGFLRFEYQPRLVAHVSPRAPAWTEPLELHPEVRRRCTELEERLGVAAEKAAYPPV